MPDEIIVDTQLLVLLVVGLTSPDYIRIHRRLTDYSAADFDLLDRAVRRASRAIVTPHVLAEASNHLRQIGDPARSAIMATFGRVIRDATEQHVPAHLAQSHAGFVRLGITDAALLAMEHPSAVLLTADADLYIAAARSGRPVENFRFLRAAARR